VTHAVTSNVCYALQEGTEVRVWQQLLRICRGRNAYLTLCYMKSRLQEQVRIML
jgi:hypothetical protein